MMMQLVSSVGAIGSSAFVQPDTHLHEGAGFGATLASVATETVQSLRNAESVSIEALQGRAGAREVVDAVMHAEQTLQTAVALRDKTVGAIQEVMRMSI
jgi:flagellar hook-basal body complex protein FliE